MEQFDINKLLKASIILIHSNEEKTLSAKAIQTVLRILHMDNPQLKDAISKATQNVTKFTSDGTKTDNHTETNHIVRQFLETEATQMVNYKIKLSSNTVPYICGLVEILGQN